METYEFTIRYEEHRVRAAARKLLIETLHPFFPWLLPLALAIGMIMIVATISYGGNTWSAGFLAGFLGLLIAANIFYWPILFSLYPGMLARQLRGSAVVKATSLDLTITSERGSYTVPWSTYKYSYRDPAYILLIVFSRANAVTIPTEGIPEAVLQFIVERVPPRSHRSIFAP